MIDKKINIKNIKLYTPDYYILTHNIIDCSVFLNDARFTLNKKYNYLSKLIDDNELMRLHKLYMLHNTINKIYKKKNYYLN